MTRTSTTHGREYRVTAALAAAALALSAARARGTITPPQEACRQAVSASLGKFGAAKEKCLAKCDAARAKDPNRFMECQPPSFGGPATQTAQCVAKAAAKSDAGIAKKCTLPGACLDCYDSALDCTPTTGFDRWPMRPTPSVEALVDGFAPTLYCDPAPSAGALNGCSSRCHGSISEGLPT